MHDHTSDTSHGQEFGQGTATLSRAAGLVADARADLTSYDRTLTDQLAALQGRWGGRGATAFFALRQAWSEKQATIVGALDDFADSLGATERTNLETDDDQHAGFARLAGRLG